MRIDLDDLQSAVTIKPAESGGVFAISSGSSREVHSNFANFVDSLQTWLDGGAAVKRIVAPGTFNNGENELFARRIHLRIE